MKVLFFVSIGIIFIFGIIIWYKLYRYNKNIKRGS